MKKLLFRCTINLDDYRRFVSTNPLKQAENVFIARYDLGYKTVFREWLQQAFNANEKRLSKGNEPMVLEIEIKSHADDRTVSANNLLWKILTLQADILNHEANSVKMITPQELYDTDMADYAPVHTITVPKNLASAYCIVAESGEDAIKGHLKERTDNLDDTVDLTFIETSSFWDTVKFADFLQIKLDELEEMGRTRYNDGYVKSLIDDFNTKLKVKP